MLLLIIFILASLWTGYDIYKTACKEYEEKWGTKPTDEIVKKSSVSMIDGHIDNEDCAAGPSQEK